MSDSERIPNNGMSHDSVNSPCSCGAYNHSERIDEALDVIYPIKRPSSEEFLPVFGALVDYPVFNPSDEAPGIGDS